MKVHIFEVGPRDGLQNEKQTVPLEIKTRYIESLIAAGAKDIEIGSFVRPDKIPQMADTEKVVSALLKKGYFQKKGLNLWTPVPNEKGLERALLSQVKAVAVFTGATDTFTQKNIGMTISESLKIFSRVIKEAHRNKLKVRGYVSVCWGCPYEGKVSQTKVIRYAKELLGLGVEQVSLGDTIGVGAPLQTGNILKGLKKEISKNKIAVHFHDTRGTALANCLTAFNQGVTTFDSSSAGLGGCNYAPGAAGNVATEDLVYMFEEMKVRTGIDLDLLCEASREVIQALGRIPVSKYLQAWLAKRSNS